MPPGPPMGGPPGWGMPPPGMDAMPPGMGPPMNADSISEDSNAPPHLNSDQVGFNFLLKYGCQRCI